MSSGINWVEDKNGDFYFNFKNVPQFFPAGAARL